MLDLAIQRPVSDTESILDSLRALRNEVRGDCEVCVAVLDGPADLSHPCFRGADLTRVDTLIQDPAGVDRMSAHGTHVASVIFGQPSSGTLGLAARCRGLLLPIFRDRSGYLSQLDLARAIEQAVMEGADIINVSGGERAPRSGADPILARALNLCDQSNVLVVAATGNDGCDCHHVPAAVPPTLAVGAMDRMGAPVQSSNFGEGYRSNGVLAPGEGIPGAVPGGAIAPFTGSSFATPVVSGLAALLMTIQRQVHGSVDAEAIRNAILDSAIPCQPPDAPECSRYLAGTLNVRGAYALITRGGRTRVTEFDVGPTAKTAQPGAGTVPWAAAIDTSAGIAPSAAPSGADAGTPAGIPAWGPPEGLSSTGAGGQGVAAAASEASGRAAPAIAVEAHQTVAPHAAPPAAAGAEASTFGAAQQGGVVGPSVMGSSGVAPSGAEGCACGTVPSGTAPLPSAPVGTGPVPAATGAMGALPAAPLGPPVAVPVPVAPVPGIVPAPLTRIFAIGNIGFDFGTEARRDTFRQLMPRVMSPDSSPPVFMAPNPYDANQLADYLDDAPYECTKIIWTLDLELSPVYAIEAEVTYAEYVYSRLRTALRNQALPSDDPNYVSRVSIPGILTTRTVRLFSGQVVPVVVAQPRGFYIWNESALVDAVVDGVDPQAMGADPDRVRIKVRQMLDKVYYQLRNLGQSPPDRAINFQATNAFIFTEAISRGLLSGEVVDGDSTNLYTLDSITAIKSPYCRVDSDCWDVQITFFDSENDRRARVVFQSTIDVSDELPVQLAPTHQFLFAA
jgi:hypothetical protein